MVSEEVLHKRRTRVVYGLFIFLILNLIVCQGNLQSESRMHEAEKALKSQSSCVCITSADPLVLVSCNEMKKF
jgi:hypothetical protein